MSDDPSYRIRWEDDTRPGRECAVQVQVDHQAGTLVAALPTGETPPMDVVMARALYMLLGEAVYAALTPAGPFLDIEVETPDRGWVGLGETR